MHSRLVAEFGAEVDVVSNVVDSRGQTFEREHRSIKRQRDLSCLLFEAAAIEEREYHTREVFLQRANSIFILTSRVSNYADFTPPYCLTRPALEPDIYFRSRGFNSRRARRSSMVAS